MSFVLYCMLFGILMFFPETDAGELTWKEPLPVQTVPDNNITDHFSKKELLEGNTNATLRWHFALTRLSFDSLTILFGRQAIAGARSSAQGPQPGFEKQYDINWVASQNLVTLFIFNVTDEVNGIFTCRVSTVKGFLTLPFSSNVEVDVVAPPSNIITSSDQTITAPANLTLNCSADGKPEPTISWTRVSDNAVVNMPLTITGGKNEESYRCTADNGVGKNLTKVVNVTILYKPVTVSLVADTTENTNCSDLLWVNLTCETSAANPPVERYQLLKSGEIQATSDDGTWIREVSEAGQHVYSCRALHFLGNVTSANKTVTFNVPGQISVFARGSEVVSEGGNVFLHCNASAYPKPTVSWSKLNADYFTVVESSWLNFTNIRRDEAGDYVCVANNTCGTRKSSRRTIDVQFAPENASLSSNLSTVPVVCVGMVVRFTCTVAACNPAVDTFTLYENGVVISDKTGSGVWIKTLDAGGKVTYKCQAKNSEGTSSSSKTLFSVEVSASATIESNSIVVKEGQDVDLVCNGSGLPLPNISWVNVSNVVIGNGRNLSLHNISRTVAGQYICTARNSCGNDSTKVDILVQYPVQATGRGENATVPAGGEKTFSCPVDGNPEPNIEWYNEKTGRKISCERQVEVKESGCYTCVASNSLGTSINITQCLIVVYEKSTTVTPTTVSGGEEIRAILKITANYEQAFKDLNSASSKEFVAKFVEEMDKVYRNMPEYIKTEVTQLWPGSVIVYFIVYFKTALTPDKGLENLRVAISSNGTLGDFQAKDLVVFSEERTKSTTTTEVKCACSDNETALLVVIGVLVTIIILLIAVIIWQQRKLRIIGAKRPYQVPDGTDAGFYDNEIAMKDVNPTHLRPKNSTQQQIPNELAYMPLKGISPTEEGPISPESPSPNVEYAPLDMRTRSWEVARNDVKVEKIIGKGAFGQVAKGTAKNLPFKSGATSVAIKMVKANAPESDKRDLKSELELMKRFKPHAHVIKLLGCVTESEPLFVLIEYVPYGDLLGYLRKSRGLNDTYYKDPDIKPKTSLTSQQLMKFAWQIADGMSYLSLKKVIHRDLAARNVLVGERETCKITDFGMARDVQEENIYERKTKGRLPVKWTAYESLLYGQYTTKSDVWSYGVVLYEISTIGGSPYPRMEGRKIASLLQQGYRMPKPEHVDNDLYQIMMNCWQNEPEARPSFSDLTQQLKRMENQHKSLIKMHIYDNTLYANLEDLNA